jgi:hypothetical protein
MIDHRSCDLPSTHDLMLQQLQQHFHINAFGAEGPVIRERDEEEDLGGVQHKLPDYCNFKFFRQWGW